MPSNLGRQVPVSTLSPCRKWGLCDSFGRLDVPTLNRICTVVDKFNETKDTYMLKASMSESEINFYL